MYLPLRNKTIGYSPLIEHLDRAYVQAGCAQAGEVLAFARLDNGDVNASQCQLAR
jgi:hypothetical protein